MKSLSLILFAAAVLGVSCERHDFEGPEGSKQLSEHHGATTVHAENAEHSESSEHKAEH